MYEAQLNASNISSNTKSEMIIAEMWQIWSNGCGKSSMYTTVTFRNISVIHTHIRNSHLHKFVRFHQFCYGYYPHNLCCYNSQYFWRRKYRIPVIWKVFTKPEKSCKSVSIFFPNTSFRLKIPRDTGITEIIPKSQQTTFSGGTFTFLGYLQKSSIAQVTQ